MDDKKKAPYVLKNIEPGMADVFSPSGVRFGHIRKNGSLWESYISQPDMDGDPFYREDDELIEVKRNKRTRHAAAMVVFFAKDDECEKAV